MPRRRWLYLLFAAVLLLDLAYLTRTYYWDGVLFSLNIEAVHRGELPFTELFHANHLLYSPLGYVLYSAASAVGFSLRAITVLQIFNVFLSAGATYVIYFLAKRLTLSSSTALACAVLFAFGATWWKFSTDADAYILCVLLLLLVYRFVFQCPVNFVAAAAFHTLAMLFHELSVFMYVPVIAAIALDSQRSRAKRFGISITYLAGTGSLVGVAYLLCYSQVDHRVYPNLIAWITSYASDSGFTHSIGQIVGSYLTSYIKLFVGGKLTFIRDYFSPLMCLALLLCLGALTWAVLQFRQVKDVEVFQRDREGAFLLWWWLVTYAVFLGMWDPGSAFHKLFLWPPIVLLLGVYIKRVRRYQSAFLGIALAIAAWNFGAFIYPHWHDSADPVLVLAEQIDRELPKRATIYYRALDPDDWYLEYFAPGRRWSPLPNSADIMKSLGDKAEGPVCLETTALESLREKPVFNRKWDLVNSGHNVRLECLASTQR